MAVKSLIVGRSVAYGDWFLEKNFKIAQEFSDPVSS
jgi:hypothetical protein